MPSGEAVGAEWRRGGGGSRCGRGGPATAGLVNLSTASLAVLESCPGSARCWPAHPRLAHRAAGPPRSTSSPRSSGIGEKMFAQLGARSRCERRGPSPTCTARRGRCATARPRRRGWAVTASTLGWSPGLQEWPQPPSSWRWPLSGCPQARPLQRLLPSGWRCRQRRPAWRCSPRRAHPAPRDRPGGRPRATAGGGGDPGRRDQRAGAAGRSRSQTAVLQVSVTEVTAKGGALGDRRPSSSSQRRLAGVRWRERVEARDRLASAEPGEPVVAVCSPCRHRR